MAETWNWVEYTPYWAATTSGVLGSFRADGQKVSWPICNINVLQQTRAVQLVGVNTETLY